VALALLGCSQAEPPQVLPQTTETARPTPSVELSDRARAVYERYLNAQIDMMREAEASTDRLAGLATPKQAELAIADVELTLAQGIRTEGRFRVTLVEQVTVDSAQLEAYVCIDNSDVVVIDEAAGTRGPASPADPVRVLFDIRDEPLVDYEDAVPEAAALQCP
jgi:hypothetical protein